MNWTAFFVVLALAHSHGEYGTDVPALNGGDVFYTADIPVTLPNALEAAVDNYVFAQSPGFEWEYMSCERGIGFYDGHMSLTSSCNFTDVNKNNIEITLSMAAQVALDAKVNVAKPGFIWRYISCLRDECGIYGAGIASSLGGIPNGATVYQQ